MYQFTGRQEAGIILAEHLKAFEGDTKAIVMALPRGGVPVGYEIAKALSLPLDVIIVRKLGVPGHEELAMGAISSGETVIYNEDIIRDLMVSKHQIDQVIQLEQAELKRREYTYRGDQSFPDLQNKTVILVDDGIATGATVRAAIRALKQKKPEKIILAVPVAARSVCKEMAKLVDKVICPLQPDDLFSVGQWFKDFSQTTDAEVTELLSKAQA